MARGGRLVAVAALLAGAAYVVWRGALTLSVETLWLGLPLALAENVRAAGGRVVRVRDLAAGGAPARSSP
jgi:hypothetical protein